MKKHPQRIEDLRNHNFGIVLGLIKDREDISRQELSVLTGLTKTTISDIVKVLLERKIISSFGEGAASSKGGRKPIHLRLNYNSAIAIGINIRRECINLVVVNLKGDIIQKNKKLITTDIDNSSLISLIKSSINEILRESPESTTVLGIGIGAPGPLNIENGEILNPPDFGKIKNLKICNSLSSVFNFPVYLSLGAAAGAYSEFCYNRSAGKYLNNIVFVEIDSGIGFGYVIDGRTIQGDKKHVAGEIGHTIVVPNGKKCVCGQKGCLYQYASGQSIINTMKHHKEINNIVSKTNGGGSETISTLELITKKLKDNNKEINNELHKSTKYMAIAMTNIINLLSPSLIVFGSSIPDFAELYLDSLRSQMSKIYPSYSGIKNRIQLSHYGINAIATGAAHIVIREFINSPNQFINFNQV